MQGKTSVYIVAAAVVVSFFASLPAEAQRRFYPRGRYYHHPPVSRYYSPRVYSYGHPYVSIGWRGMNYRYQRGYYYRPYGASFQVVLPPIGIRIGTLPVGYRRVMVGPNPYYYYNNTYYRPYDDQYEVVAPPLGASVDELPPGAKVKVIDGEKYYELDGTYYAEEISDKGDLSYRVVGTDGVLNTDTDSTAEPINEEPVIGDRFDDLPADSKSVVVQGEKLYLSPDGLYYKEVIEGNKVVYEVVGK